jgi:NCS1 family nucleobase:cation symporter-1
VSSDVQTGEGALSVEQNGINVIPESERKGQPRDLFWPWFAANVSVLAIGYGAYLLGFGGGISFWQGLIAGVIGIIFSFLLVGFVSLSGKHASAPTMVISRAPFGIYGNALPSAVSYVLLVGWETVLVSLGALATATVFDELGWASGTTAKILGFLITAALVIFAVILGFDLIMSLQKWVTLLTIVLTIGYILLTLSHVHWHIVSSHPSGGIPAFLGAVVFAMTGFGLGWVNSGADYSRYLPRAAQGRSIVWWTTFAASIAPLVLVFYGLLLAGSDQTLFDAIYNDPIGALTLILPTWFLLPYLVVVLLGLVGGAVLDIYSSGLALLTLGLRIPRWSAAAIDGVIMVIGAWYVVFKAPNFFFPFQGFLITLGVPIAAWAGVFLADMWTRKRDYAQDDLYHPGGRYGAFGWSAFLLMILGTVVGWGLVTNTYASWLDWQGFLFRAGGVADDSPWLFSNIGVLLALAIGFFGQLILGRGRVHRQEELDTAVTA